MIDLGISERLNQLFTGKTPTTGHDNLFYKNIVNSNAMKFPVEKRSSDQPKSLISVYNQATGKPADIGSSSKSNSGSGSGSSSNDSKIIANIGKSWDDMGDSYKSTSKLLGSSKNYISNLGKVRDQYLKSLDAYKQKNEAAIAGNKTLIEQNQKKDLDSLAEDLRNKTASTNVMLGVASSGSAGRAAARALGKSVGKQRAGVLTNYGDEFSKQNQEAKQALEKYNIERAQAYEWEETARKQALDDYNEAKSALDRLSKKKSGWKDSDIKAMSDRNLNKLFGSLSEINARAKNFRDTLAAKYTEYGGRADELEVAAVDIAPPAELETPEFDENINFNEEEGEDFFDPNKTGKRVIKGYDALGNPIYEDETAISE